MQESVLKKIDFDIKNNDVVLYMKGTKTAPMCGFSATVVSILNSFSVPFVYFNVLEDSSLREAIKQYSDWPTIPQLYIKGEFIGGCDIAKEMYSDGSLKDLFIKYGIIK